MIDTDKSQEKPMSTSIEDGIGIRLRATREAKGLSQIDLHNKTGLSRTVLINYEAGRHKPGARELRLLCDALEVSPNHLIYGSEEPHARSTGLADIILNMGEAAIVPAIFLGPMLSVMLGKDDTRMVLSLIESLLKAKDPAGYAAVMKFVEAIRDISNKAPDEKKRMIEELQSNPAAAEEFRQQMLNHFSEMNNSNKN